MGTEHAELPEEFQAAGQQIDALVRAFEDPPFQIWMTHTPARDTAKELLSYSGDAVSLYTHSGTHLDALNHFGLHGKIWNQVNAEDALGVRGWTKSGAILPQQVNGKWWMYYLGTRKDADGQPRDHMGLAVSPDLLHWTDAMSTSVLQTRPRMFDSNVVEPGPPPIVTDQGILLIYNGADDYLEKPFESAELPRGQWARAAPVARWRPARASRTARPPPRPISQSCDSGTDPRVTTGAASPAPPFMVERRRRGGIFLWPASSVPTTTE